MGLANLLQKRAAAGSGQAKTHDTEEDLRKDTRTAWRKRRKLEQRQRAEQAAARRAARGAAAAAVSEDEEEKEAKELAASGHDRAYGKLLELMGPAASSDDEDNFVELSAGSEVVSGDEEDVDGDARFSGGDDADGDSDDDDLAEDAEGSEAETKSEEDEPSSASSSDEDVNGTAVTNKGSVKDSGKMASNGSVPAAGMDGVADSALPDHLARVLTEAEVGKLMSGTRKFNDLPSPIESKVTTMWPDARLLVSEEAASPQLPAPTGLADYGVKERLAARWRELTATEPGAELATPQQAALYSMLSSHADLLHAAWPYPTPDQGSVDPELDAVLLHILQRVMTSGDRIRRNNERLKAGGREDAPRDQGFTRPTVLLLLPMRSLALQAIGRLAQLGLTAAKGVGVQGLSRFEQEYGLDAVTDEEGVRVVATSSSKPTEHQALFGGNADDHFRMGVKLGRGGVKLYSDFFGADIIVASPLALAAKLADPADADGTDYLSSIEIAVVVRADVVLMQNWDHVITVFGALNKQPKEQRGADIMRVRQWFLEGWGGCYRQNILLSSFLAPEMLALLRRYGCSWTGGYRLEHRSPQGVLPRVLPQLRQVFERLNESHPAREPEARFACFRDELWPRIRDSARGGGQLLYIPSYFDFVRVRNFLRSEGASMLLLSEYTDGRDAARARSYFAQKRRKILLYTERAQFYNRSSIKGINDIVFYQLPSHAHFYEELLNQVQESAAAGVPTVTVMFSPLDRLRLEGIVGGARAGRMLKPTASPMFLLC